MSSPIARVRGEAERFDDASLEHLANKGLVRRAKKLLAGEHTVDFAETEAGCVVSGAEWSVEFSADSPVQDGRCGCSTAGVCQHLIAAIVHLRETAPGSPSTETVEAVRTVDAETIEQALLALTDDELTKWAKTADSRWAASRAEALNRDEVEVERSEYLAVTLPTPHPSVLFMGPTLDDAIVKPAGPKDRRSVALSVLALWKREGRNYSAPAAKSNAPINELVEERSSVLRRAQNLAEELLAVGLLYASEVEAERIGSLSASLRGVKLYRLAALAERSADQIDALVALSAAADSARLLSLLAELHVVAEATARRLANGVALPVGLVGSARAAYENVGHLDLIGLGSYHWENARFAGTTTVVAQSATTIYSVHETTRANGRSLANSGWTGVSSISAVTGHRMALANAQASADTRLSSGEKSTVSVGSLVSSAEIADLAWDGSLPSTGSRLLGSPSSVWAVCRVDDVQTPAYFDEIEQTVLWRFVSMGKEVIVRLPYREGSSSVDNLEALAGETSNATRFRKRTDPIEFVVGRMRRSASGGIDLWPISVVLASGLRNLADPTEATKSTEVREGPSAEAVMPVTQVERLTTELTRLAEGGRRTATDETIGQVHRRAEQAGLAVIAKIIDHAPTTPRALLRSTWALELAQDADR